MGYPPQFEPTGTVAGGTPAYDGTGQLPPYMAPNAAEAAYLYPPPPYMPARPAKPRNSLSAALVGASFLLAGTSILPWMVLTIQGYDLGVSVSPTLFDLTNSFVGEAWPALVLLCMGVAVVGAILGGLNPSSRGASAITGVGFAASTATIAFVLAAGTPASGLSVDDLFHTAPGMGMWAALLLAAIGACGAGVRLLKPDAFTTVPPPVPSWSSPWPGPWGMPTPGPWGAPTQGPWGAYPYPPQQGWPVPSSPTPPSPTAGSVMTSGDSQLPAALTDLNQVPK
jgi:hypothetical protein